MNTILGSGLLAASMLLGQPGDPPSEKSGGKTVGPAPMATQPSFRPVIGWLSREERPTFSRFGSWFKRDQKDPPKDAPIVQTKPGPALPPVKDPASNDFPRKLPNPSSQSKTPAAALAKGRSARAPKEVQQVTLQQIATPKSAKSPISTQLANKIGRDEKFEWITGQLEIENGNHVLYYATPETIDKYHGRIVLLPQQVDMTQFKKGDLVSVRGTVTQRQTTQGMVPIYRITMASLIERPKAL
ncbi:MAG: hypothetical protein EXR98_16675 [Gemmataceae bacterium]|nr:hypothetical protein [Gemmataceae bacterium]